MGKSITLREEFESETGSHAFADQQYIKWLEKVVEKERAVKNSSIPNVVGQSEQLVCDCGNKLTDKEIYFGQCLQCDANVEE